MTEKIIWSGVTSAYTHKHTPTAKLPPDTKLGVRKVWLLDAQWSTCPIEVENQVRVLWRFGELGNDKYIFKTTIEELLEFQDNPEDYTCEQWNDEKRKWEEKPITTDAIVQYLREMGVGDNEQVLIHWWW